MSHLWTVAPVALVTLAALVPPRRPRSLASAGFWLGYLVNEFPFFAVCWLATSTLLALANESPGSPAGLAILGLAALTACGLALITWRELLAGRVVARALSLDLGRGATAGLTAGRLSRRVPARAVFWPWPLRPRTVRRISNISYGDAGRRNRLDLYRHRSRPTSAPVLIHFHGGHFRMGSKSREARALFYRLADQGWVCISADYRVRKSGRFPASQVDAKRAIAWARGHAAEYGADPSLLVVAGSSAGAHLASMAALTVNDPAFQPGFEHADTSVSAAVCLYGFYGSRDLAGALPSSPRAYVRPDAPPFFVAHGENDSFIAAAQAQSFVDRLRSISGNPVIYAQLPGAQHSFDLLHSVRFQHVIDGIEVFTGWVRTGRDPAGPPHTTGSGIDRLVPDGQPRADSSRTEPIDDMALARAGRATDRWSVFRLTLVRALWASLLALAVTTLVSGCGGPAASARTTLARYLAAWGRGEWAAMRSQVLDPPRDFTTVNSDAFRALGVSHASFSALRITTTRTGDSARARVSEHFTVPHVGGWAPMTTVSMVKRGGTWHVRWSPATVNPALRKGEKLALRTVWPLRAPILSVDGTPLTSLVPTVTVGLFGERIKNASAVRADLIGAGATSAQVSHALAQAAAHPTALEPVFTVSQARFDQLKSEPTSQNVYSVPGTGFERTSASAAVTSQLTAHVVGSLGPITAQELQALGAPYDTSSIVGQSGLQSSQERTLAGAPSTHIDIEDAGGNPIKLLASFGGRPGVPVRTSIDLPVQRAAEQALAHSSRPDVSMVAIRASTGQVLAVVSDPVSTYDTALEGAYPPGSTFKVLTFTALHAYGLTPTSRTSCPPTVAVNGESFHNAPGVGPASTLDAAFTESCNTAFISLAGAHLSPTDYPAAARLYGLTRTPQLGLPAFSANVPEPRSQTELAADAIGQGRLTFSALGMAQVAAAIDSGVVRPPRLVRRARDGRQAVSRLPAGLVADLRAMMAQVTTSGTAAGMGLPPGTHAKTGTAEYGAGTESQLKIDGWLMGYYGDIAFAIVTQDTGGLDGGPVDGPLISKFLDALTSSA